MPPVEQPQSEDCLYLHVTSRHTTMPGERCYVENAPFEEERRAWDALHRQTAG